MLSVTPATWKQADRAPSNSEIRPVNTAYRFRRPILAAAAFVLGLGLLSTQPLFAQAADDQTAPAGAPGEIKNVAVIAVSSYNELISNVGFLGSLADRPELGQMIEGTLALFTQGKGLNGIDKTKPWGVILQTDGQQFLPVGCLPVTDLNQLLGIAQGFGAKVQDTADGGKQIDLPNGKSIFVKAASGWAFLAQSGNSLAHLPADPQSAFADLVTNYNIGARVSVQNVPTMYRQLAIQAMKSGMEQGLQRKEGEDDETYEARRKMAEVQMEQVERMVNEIDDVTFGWAIDTKEQKTFVDFVYRFVASSKMAKQIASYGKPQTNYAGFYQPEAAVTMNFASKADPQLIKEDMEQFTTMIDSMRKQAEKAIDEENELPDQASRDALKGAMNDFLDAAQATIEGGQMDGGASLVLHPDSLTFVAGFLVKQPEKFESGLKKIAEVGAKEPDFGGVQWNAANHAGVNFHTMSVPVPEDQEDARKLLGDKVDIAVGIGKEAVYVAIGHDNLNAVYQAIDASSAEPNKAVSPFELSISLGPLMETAAANGKEQDQEILQSIADMLENTAQGRDHIRVTGKFIPNGLQYRVEAEEGVLRAIGKGVTEAQRKAQEAQKPN
jgi:hypothetical protein